MAIPKNKLSFVSKIISDFHKEGENPLDMNFVMNNDDFEILPHHIVNFYIESNILLEPIVI